MLQNAKLKSLADKLLEQAEEQEVKNETKTDDTEKVAKNKTKKK